MTLIGHVEEIEDTARGYRDEVFSVLQITATNAFSRRYLMSALSAFRIQHPSVEIDFRATDQVVNIVKDGFDIATRQTRLFDSTLIIRKITDDYRVLSATSNFLARYGWPRTLGDVQCLPAVTFDHPLLMEAISLHQKRSETICLSAGFYTSSGYATYAAAI